MGFEALLQSGNISFFGYFGGQMKRYLLHAAHIVLMFSATKSLIAQQQSLSDCFGAFDLSFPVNQDGFSALELAADDAPVVRYLFEDQYTFWYRLTSNRTDTLKFTISNFYINKFLI